MLKSLKAAWEYYSHPGGASGPLRNANRVVRESGITDYFQGETYLGSHLQDGSFSQNGPYNDTSRSGLWIQGERD